jgi:hypothetical protein
MIKTRGVALGGFSCLGGKEIMIGSEEAAPIPFEHSSNSKAINSEESPNGRNRSLELAMRERWQAWTKLCRACLAASGSDSALMTILLALQTMIANKIWLHSGKERRDCHSFVSCQESGLLCGQ